jgi:transposase
MPVQEANKLLINVTFSLSDCKVCPVRTLCTRTTRRSRTLHPKEQTAALKETYRHRAGSEGVHSQEVRPLGLHRSRSIGLRKTHLAHVAVAAALNLV